MPEAKNLLRDYRPDGAALAAFLASRAFARALAGPRGGGRKVAASVDIARRVNAAPAGRWRVAVAMARADDLAGAAMRAVAETFGADHGKWDLPGRRFAIDWAAAPGAAHDGRRWLEFLFCGVDRPQQRAELERAEANIVWLAGARDLPLEICELALELAGSCGEREQAGLIVTSRMPDPAHWIASRFHAGAANWQLFRQPGGREASAENLTHLRAGFYARLAERLPAHEIASEVDGEWRERTWDIGDQIDSRRLALAALWHLRGGFPPPSEGARR